MSESTRPTPLDIALARYQVISAYIALDPPRGQRGQLLLQLAERSWPWPDGAARQFSAETLRVWVRRYRKQGLSGLEDKPRPRPGVQVLEHEVQALVCRAKRDVPERSLDRLIKILERTGKVESGLLRRSTVHRLLRAEGISGRPRKSGPDDTDLDRFEADHPNELWQSDMLAGPWLPDPARPGKMRRSWLYAFIDDHSRLLLHGRFYFKGDLPALELVLRRCLQRYGVPRVCYYDNGGVYRARHMKQIVATLGMRPITYTTRHRPMGHGKIEALNKLIKAAFIAEVRSSSIGTLDELNEAFLAWADRDYNLAVHSEIGETPRTRWRRTVDRVRFADEEDLRQAFLWREQRKADKAGLLSLFGTRYQVGPELARRRLEIRYDPERLEEIEIWLGDRFRERVQPFEVKRHRRPKPTAEVPETEPPQEPVVDWLGHLVAERRAEGFVEPDPRQLARDALVRRREATEAVVALLDDRLKPAVVDCDAIVEFCARFGPFDAELAAEAVDAAIAAIGRTDQHVRFYLDAIRQHTHPRQEDE